MLMSRVCIPFYITSCHYSQVRFSSVIISILTTYAIRIWHISIMFCVGLFLIQAACGHPESVFCVTRLLTYGYQLASLAVVMLFYLIKAQV